MDKLIKDEPGDFVPRLQILAKILLLATSKILFTDPFLQIFPRKSDVQKLIYLGLKNALFKTGCRQMGGSSKRNCFQSMWLLLSLTILL